MYQEKHISDQELDTERRILTAAKKTTYFCSVLYYCTTDVINSIQYNSIMYNAIGPHPHPTSQKLIHSYGYKHERNGLDVTLGPNSYKTRIRVFYRNNRNGQLTLKL